MVSEASPVEDPTFQQTPDVLDAKTAAAIHNHTYNPRLPSPGGGPITAETPPSELPESVLPPVIDFGSIEQREIRRQFLFKKMVDAVATTFFDKDMAWVIEETKKQYPHLAEPVTVESDKTFKERNSAANKPTSNISAGGELRPDGIRPPSLLAKYTQGPRVK